MFGGVIHFQDTSDNVVYNVHFTHANLLNEIEDKLLLALTGFIVVSKCISAFIVV